MYVSYRSGVLHVFQRFKSSRQVGNKPIFVLCEFPLDLAPYLRAVLVVDIHEVGDDAIKPEERPRRRASIPLAPIASTPISSYVGQRALQLPQRTHFESSFRYSECSICCLDRPKSCSCRRFYIPQDQEMQIYNPMILMSLKCFSLFRV